MISSKKTLYIIGNGFDLHHGIPSSFRDFGEFLEKSNNGGEVKELIEEYLFSAEGDVWGKFEDNLANLDSDLLLENASTYLIGYGAEDWSDSYHHDYQYEIGQVVSTLSHKLLKHFERWVSQLPIASPKETLINLNREAIFFTFNYTPTLSKLYGIPENRILFLHGKAEDSSIVLGHGWRNSEAEPIEGNYEDDSADIDVRIQQGDDIIKNYFERTFKPTDEIILKYREEFKLLKSIDEIIILGHSMSDVDLPYFEEIKRHIDVDKVQWKVSFFDDYEFKNKILLQLDIPSALVKLLAIKDLIIKEESK